MRFRAVCTLVLLTVVVGCGSSDPAGSPATSPEASTTTLAGPEASPHLRGFASGTLDRPALVPTASGLLVLGGAPEEYEQPLVPVDDATIVHSDGTVTVLEPPPGGPMASTAGSAHDDTVFIVGTRCARGQLDGDTSALTCEPGGAALLRLDLATAGWTELALPADAPDPGGFLGDQAVYALDGAVVYQVSDDIGPDGRLPAWFSVDGGASWDAMPSEPAGAYCAAGGVLLAVDTDESAPGTDGVGAATFDDDADTGLGLTVRTFDTGDAEWGPAESPPEEIRVVGGATSVSCVPDVGAAAFTLTGGTSGAVVVYSVAEGWSIVEDPDGAELSATLPSWGSGLLAPRGGTDDLVRFDATGASTTVTLPTGSRPVAGIGDAVFVVTEAGDPAVIQP